MFSIHAQSQAILRPLLAMLLFAPLAAAEIPGLCSTGETGKVASACTGVLVTPNPPGGGPNRDGNWQLAYPFPSALSMIHGPCTLDVFVSAWVDTPDIYWMSNGASSFSEWITPYDGESYIAPGWYVYRTAFPVPLVLPGGTAPTGLTINARLASDNSAYTLYMASLAHGGSCAMVTGLPIPIDPDNTFTQWWDVSFTNPIAITPGSELFFYIVVQNAYDDDAKNGDSPTGLRVEFFPSSTFY